MTLNPKKWIGALGRRYGGKPFQVVRKFCYDTILLPGQANRIACIWRKRYAPNMEEQEMIRKYYTQESNPQVKPGVVCVCDGHMLHGGITDRQKGILNTYGEARRRGLPFYIYWVSPYRLEDYLVPNRVDWRISDSEISYSLNDSFPVIIDERHTYQGHADNTLRLKAALHKALPQTHVFSNANNREGKYRELYNDLFKPSDALQAEIDKHLKLLGNEYHVFAFRFMGLLGEFSDWKSKPLEETEAEALIKKVIDEFEKEIAKIPANSRILVTSDSHVFLNRIKGIDSRIYIVPGEVKHTDFDGKQDSSVYMKTFVDQQLQMRAHSITLMRTDGMYSSGFPRFAAEIGGVPFRLHEF